MGAKFVKFLVSAESDIGSGYLRWTKPDEGDAYTTFDGAIQIDTHWLPDDPTKWTPALLIQAAGLFVHEGVESYYDLGLGIKTQASQHMDYVAQYFAGQVKTELGQASNIQTVGNVAYGLSFAQWRARDGQNYASEPVNQSEVTQCWGQLLAFLVQRSDVYDNAMGLTTDMLTSPRLPGPPIVSTT
jgi:hypothetical protein